MKLRELALLGGALFGLRAVAACSDAVRGDAPLDAGADSGGTPDAQVDGDAAGGCYVGEDCNQTTEVCDPDTRQCAPFECTPLGGCAPGEVCADQVAGAAVGACYVQCSPFAGVSGCAEGLECPHARIDGTIGICKPPGENTLGKPCVSSVVSTDCAPGLNCYKVLEGGFVCARPCDYWGGAKLCDSASRCHPDLLCVPQITVQAAAVGQACPAAAQEFWSCGPDPTKVGGLCIQEGASLVCRSICRTALGNGDCQSGETCVASTIQPILGVCRP